jgi:hypothetical protein
MGAQATRRYLNEWRLSGSVKKGRERPRRVDIGGSRRPHRRLGHVAIGIPGVVDTIDD